ncbi:MAG: Asp-tRNA(Asn)/Glu-tRNA(Gln) amidotransferase subunit GatC [Anaerolineaceae bacterium]|jgi:aspartyl-tRNA(Asn)/glutamyl-tRNA(Gln) amidotransferase subunit C
MSLTLSEVEHIAELARLELTDKEKELFRQQLSEILDYAARLQSIDTSQITLSSAEPAEARLAVAPHSILRPDVPAPSLKVKEVLYNAPQAEDDQFRVPPVLEQAP